MRTAGGGASRPRHDDQQSRVPGDQPRPALYCSAVLPLARQLATRFFVVTASEDHTARVWDLRLDMGTLEQWSLVAETFVTRTTTDALGRDQSVPMSTQRAPAYTAGIPCIGSRTGRASACRGHMGAMGSKIQRTLRRPDPLRYDEKY